MKFEKTKTLASLFAVSLSCFALFLALSVFFAGKGAYHGVFERNHVAFSIVMQTDGEEILSDKKALSLPKKRLSLMLENSEKETARFSLWQNGVEKGEWSLKPGEKKIAEIHSDGGSLSLLLQKEDLSIGYLSDVESFREISKKMPDGGDLVFLSETKLQRESLNGLFRLFGEFTFEELSVDTEKKGEIVLCPKKPFSADLYVFAPKCEIFWKSFKPSFDSSAQNFYLKAKRVNEKKLSPSQYPIDSFEQLSRLASDEMLPRLVDGAEIRINASFQMRESLSVQGLAKIDFAFPVEFGGNTLTFCSDHGGVYEVNTALGAGIDGASLLFQAPLATLVWTGEGTIPAISTVEKGSNVKAYNGLEPSLGGEGTAIPKLILYAEGNRYLEEDVTFEVQGNCLVASLPYLLSKKSLDEANFALSCDNGTASLQGLISNGVIVTEDSEGKERRFAVRALRDPYQIPVVHLETEGGAEITSKSQYISATFALDGGESEYGSLSETHIRIRGRGNSTWKWEKKPYKIHFDEPTSILGLPAAEEWALFSNYADKSLMRNRLAQVMASKLSFEYCPTQVCVDVFLNGEYLGVYTLGEHLEAGDGRVEIDYDMSRTDCGYFLEAGGVVSGVDVKGMNYFHAGLVKFVLIKMPEYNTMTSEQFEYIHNFMLKADEAVKKGEGYEEYLDVDSVIDWLIMTELSCNTDCTWRRSTYFTKEPGGKLVMGPVWDFDLAFGNFSKDNPGDDTWVSSEPDDDYVGETWSTHLLEDPEFQARFKARWQEVRDVLVDSAMEEIEKQYQLNSASAELNFKRWDILGKKVAFERHDTKNYRTYSSQIYYLQDFITNRAAWIDEQVKNFA